MNYFTGYPQAVQNHYAPAGSPMPVYVVGYAASPEETAIVWKDAFVGVLFGALAGVLISTLFLGGRKLR